MTDRHEGTGATDATGEMRKMAVYLGLVEDDCQLVEDDYQLVDDDRQDGERRGPDDAIMTALYFGAEQARLPHEPSYDVEQGLQRFSTWLDGRTGPSATAATMARHPSLVQPTNLAHITTLHPRTYNDARTIGEHLREGTPVIMNLAEMTDSDAKRLVDFAAGLIFGVRGSIDRVTNKVFLLSPANVEVTAEDKARIAERGFFNQS